MLTASTTHVLGVMGAQTTVLPALDQTAWSQPVVEVETQNTITLERGLSRFRSHFSTMTNAVAASVAGVATLLQESAAMAVEADRHQMGNTIAISVAIMTGLAVLAAIPLFLEFRNTLVFLTSGGNAFRNALEAEEERWEVCREKLKNFSDLSLKGEKKLLLEEMEDIVLEALRKHFDTAYAMADSLKWWMPGKAVEFLKRDEIFKYRVGADLSIKINPDEFLRLGFDMLFAQVQDLQKRLGAALAN